MLLAPARQDGAPAAYVRCDVSQALVGSRQDVGLERAAAGIPYRSTVVAPVSAPYARRDPPLVRRPLFFVAALDATPRPIGVMQLLRAAGEALRRMESQDNPHQRISPGRVRDGLPVLPVLSCVSPPPIHQRGTPGHGSASQGRVIAKPCIWVEDVLAPKGRRAVVDLRCSRGTT